MDIFVSIQGIAGFLFYILTKMLLLRLSSGRQVMNRAFMAFIFSVEIHLVFWVISYYLLVFPEYFPGWPLIVFYILVSLMISIGLITGYTFAVLGTATTSLRVQMLSVIAITGEKGISDQDFMSRYNAKVMVSQRLARFSESGEVEKRDEKYWPGKVETFYCRFTGLILFLNRLYRNDIYRV